MESIARIEDTISHTVESIIINLPHKDRKGGSFVFVKYIGKNQSVGIFPASTEVC